MPRSALEYLEADYRLRSMEIAALLTRLAPDELTQEAYIRNDDEEGLEQRIAKEVMDPIGNLLMLAKPRVSFLSLSLV